MLVEPHPRCFARLSKEHDVRFVVLAAPECLLSITEDLAPISSGGAVLLLACGGHVHKIAQPETGRELWAGGEVWAAWGR